MKLLFLFFSFCCFAESVSLEEKLAQLLMVHFHGKIANEDARILVQDLGVGGVIYFNWSNALESKEQVLTLSQSLQQMAKRPLLIAVDQEGGRVARLKQGFTSFPSNQAVAETNNPELALEISSAIAKDLLSAGVNMNLAPVVDINSNPLNPVIGDRSFGVNSEVVVQFGKKALEGYQSEGVLATLKHFPGHGDVDQDSHTSLPILQKTKEEIEAFELVPFKELAPASHAIMTAHILIPAWDPDFPATVSKTILGYLREEMHFDGVIITDSLVMEGILKQCHTVDEAAIQALEAGCDLLLLGGKTSNHELSVKDVRRVHQSLVQAVKSSRLSEERVDQAFQRVMELKRLIISTLSR